MPTRMLSLGRCNLLLQFRCFSSIKTLDRHVCPTPLVGALSRTAIRWLAAICLTVLGMLSLSCGGGSSTSLPNPTPSAVSVTISPTTASIVVGETQPFTATVSGSSNTSVTWSVNGVNGGNPTVGTISATGLYTAPPLVPNPASVSITAKSAADSSKAASAQVSVKLKISISPMTPSVELFHAQQFSAAIVGVSNTTVQWSINDVQGGNSVVGTIDSTGIYTAPIFLPSPATVNVKATSVADPSQTASTTTTLVADTSPPQVVSVTPADMSSGVVLNGWVAITFNEGLDPSTLTPPTFALTQGTTSLPITISYDPTTYVVTLTPPGILAPLTTYTITIGTQLRDEGGNPLAAPYSASFTTVGGTSVPSSVTSPPGLDPTSLNVISLQGQRSTPASDGSFSASVRPQGTTGVVAMVPGEAFGLFAISIGNSGSTSSVSRSRKVLSRVVNGTVVYTGRWQISIRPADTGDVGWRWRLTCGG